MIRIISLAAAGALALAAGAANAQSLPSSAGAFNAGYNRTLGQENQPAAASLRDANGNPLFAGGLLQHGDLGSLALSGASSLAAGASAGAGAVASSLGDNLVVMTQGNWRTVIVGQASSAGSTADLNGKIDLDGPN